MPTTDNHDIEIPPAGDEHWEQKLTRDLQAFETAIPLFDAAGTIDSTVVDDPHAPHQGAWLLASDTGALFRGDGTAWTHHGSVPRTATATATGDGTTTQFTLVHDLGTTPLWVGVTPTTAAAGDAHHVADRTSTEVTIEYASAPADGAALAWDLAVLADAQPHDDSGGST